MELDKLNQLLGRELNEVATPVRMARRRAIKTALETDEPGEESSSGKWSFASPQGVKVTELSDDAWQVEFEDKLEKGDFETILKKAKAFSKEDYRRREAKLE